MFARFMRKRTAFGRLVAITLGVTGIYAVLVGLKVGGKRPALWVDDLGLAVAAALAGVAAMYVAGRRTDRSRRAWQVMAAACFFWSAGEVTWSFYELVLNREMPFPSWADAFYLAGTVAAILGVILLGRDGDGASGSLRRLLDGCILGGSLLLVSWVAVLDSVVKTSTDGTFAMGVSLAYPIGDVITLAVAISIATHTRRRGRQAMLILAGGMVLQAITDSVFVGLAAHNSFTGGLIDSGWFLGYLLIGLAALRDLSPSPEKEISSAGRRLINVMVPYAAAVISLVIRMTQEVMGHNGPFLFWCGSVVTILVL